MTSSTTRFKRTAFAVFTVLTVAWAGFAHATQGAKRELDVALVAKPATSYVSGHEDLDAINDGYAPTNSGDHSHGAYGNWPASGRQWVQYEWTQPVATNKVEVYWFDDERGVRLPTACSLQYWNGSQFVDVPGAVGLGVEGNKFNVTTFPEVKTRKLRLTFESQGRFSTGILEWRVIDSGNTPNFGPNVRAGAARSVVVPGTTYLTGFAIDDGKPYGKLTIRWSKLSGPGNVAFADPKSLTTTAKFGKPGNYVLRLTADDGLLKGTSELSVRAVASPPATHLKAAPMAQYRITSKFWGPRIKGVIVNWIPHCIAKIEDPNLPEGGLDNFVQAALKLQGKPHGQVHGAVFTNAWVYNTLEAMCWALMVDPQGDSEIAAAQASIRQTLAKWVPTILAAQEPDGYLDTQYTVWGHKRWSNLWDHEGYIAGYFIDSALAHYTLTNGQDQRLYKAAKKLADCWYKNVGPGSKSVWYDGHESIEQSLVKLAAFVDEKEGAGKGAKYLKLAKHLMSNRKNGEDYDQTQAPVTQQYEAVGHAVRAAYLYNAMIGYATATGDLEYHSAAQSLWDSIVNRKYYVTGGLGSGETSEGFGRDYSLPTSAYCESCADCGELFFQNSMLQAYRDAKYADLYEDTLYNAILGSLDLEGNNFTYTNPLDSSERRYGWHGCPCCIGNIPRTLLELPTWMYSTSSDGLFVNLYVGSSTTVKVAGSPVKVAQATEYPWNGAVQLTLSPAKARRFSVWLRVPNHAVSKLYTATPNVQGLSSIKVNGKAAKAVFKDGYAVLTRTWKPGDRIQLVIPMQVQRVKGDPRIEATRGRVALRYGPLVYNLEGIDCAINSVLQPGAALKTTWESTLLGGVMVIRGKFSDGKPMVAIPNYARLNRGTRSMVWIKDK